MRSISLSGRGSSNGRSASGGFSLLEMVVAISILALALAAMDQAASGATRWAQDLDAPAVAPATVRGNLVYVVGRDSTAWALDTGNGRIVWQRAGTPSVANFGGSAAPATQVA